MNSRALHAHKKTSTRLGLCRRDSIIASIPLAARNLGSGGEARGGDGSVRDQINRAADLFLVYFCTHRVNIILLWLRLTPYRTFASMGRPALTISVEYWLALEALM